MMQAHFVQFYSPGSFTAEVSQKPIYAWDIKKAVEMALEICERHGARPYGFRFTTRSRGDADLDSKVTDTSPMYYLGGKVETREEIEARNDPNERILRDNMRYNSYDRVIVNDNSWRWMQPLEATDVILEGDFRSLFDAKRAADG